MGYDLGMEVAGQFSICNPRIGIRNGQIAYGEMPDFVIASEREGFGYTGISVIGIPKEYGHPRLREEILAGLGGVLDVSFQPSVTGGDIYVAGGAGGMKKVYLF